MIAAALYTLHFVGGSDDLAAYGAQPSWAPQFSYARPNLIAFSPDATSAVVSHVERTAHEIVLVTRSDGRRVTVRMPSDRELATTVPEAAFAPANADVFAGTKLERVLFGSDGTLFCDVITPFSGGYSGFRERAFRWSNGAWKQVFSGHPPALKQYWIAAAERISTIAIVEDELDAQPAQSGDPDDVDLLYQGRSHRVGHGIATAMRGGYASGYDPTTRNPHLGTSALLWANSRRAVLGLGIAWDTNDRGEAVGDDRRSVDASGHPIRWFRGGATRLSQKLGSAFAVGGDGTVVGAYGDDGFVRFSGGGARPLDGMVRDRAGWHIFSAFAIARNGSILAAARSGDAVRIVRLDVMKAQQQGRVEPGAFSRARRRAAAHRARRA